MGLDVILWCSLLLYNSVVASPHFDTRTFLRSAVETVPQHEAISTPIRSSVESIPLRSLRDEGDKRLPLRDAVERRPISLINEDAYKIILENEKDQNADNLRLYYGAAGYLNNGERNDERLHQGNANLQEMQQTSSDPVSQRLVVCYMESWAAYRAPPLAFTAGLVPKSCTHLHYAFAVMHPHTYAVTAANEDYDVVKGGYRIATGLKHRFPGMKVLISVGGDGTERLFSEMVQEPHRRSSFISSAIKFVREHNFDGLDLHWVYAGEKSDKEKEMLTSLLYELREKFSSYGFLISTVLPPFRYQIEDGYDLRALSGAADYVVLQAWDMTHGKRDEAPSKAVQHSALHRDPGAASRDQRYENIEFIVGFILRHGMSPEKLVLGVPMFGRSYTLAPSTLPAPGALVSDWGEEGLYTQTKGSLAYFEICMAEREGKGASGVDENGNSYAIFGDQWVAYDTPSTVSEKMKFILSTGLAGAAAWSIDMDDFRGLCGSPFPLLSVISTSLNGDSIQSDQSSLKIGSCDADGPYLASDPESCAHFHFCSGGIGYRMMCEEDRLYDPSTGFCGHQDVAKCIPGQSLRISVMDAARFLPEAYETDFEWSHPLITNPESMKFVDPYSLDIKKNKDNDKRVVCYMTSWAFYRRGEGKFVPENVDTRLCTHIVYAYASLSPDELIAKEFDPWADVTNNLYERVTSLKDVKVLLGLGGWTDSAGDKYSRLVSSGAARTKFTEKLVAFLRTNNFQGLHLDWNYPVCWQSNCKKGAVSDKANYAKLVQEVSRALHSAGMELGVALSGYKEVIDAAYDLPALSQAADFLSTMTYDYHGGWERTTAHHTPLIPSSKDTLPYYSIEYAIKALLKGGADPKKLLLGLSFYGQSFRLADVDGRSGPGTPAAGPGEPGEFTKQPGMLAYYEICYRVKNLRWKSGKQENAGPYAYSDNQWVGYDDPKSITEKVKWAIGQGLGGVTAWAIDLDDFSNRCCAEPSPLLRAAGRALGRSVPPPPSTACERPPEPATPAPPTTTTAISDGSGGSGDHGSHGHEHHTSTTWPSWTPAATTPSTTQSWWTSAATTTTTTTTRKPTTTSTKPSAVSGPCKSGSYRAVEGECDSYLQCEGGQWRKQRCAPGLHWAAALNRCDWPTFAKCTMKPTSEASTATSTLAPITSRPPLPTTTTTRPTTTTRATTTTRTTTTARTTTRSTTTTKPTTTTSGGVAAGASLEGTSCSGSEYRSVSGNCNSYLHCDGVMWRLQQCAPGLHWSQTELHCDWPKYAKCEGGLTKPSTTAAPAHTVPPRPSKPPVGSGSSPEAVEDGPCSASSSHAAASSCDSYLLCVGGRWRKQLCPPGLHWDKRTNRCDWIEFAMCDVKPGATKAPVMTTTTTRQPIYSRPTSKKPVETTPSTMRCRTGTYHPHARCEKFYVCVNGKMVEQSCAPGLVWGADRGTCDFPGAASCSRHDDIAEPAFADSTQHFMQQTKYCDNGEYATFPEDCTRYRHCLFGTFQEFACSPGLHWNQEIQICDWPKNAKCKTKDKPIISTPTATETVLKPKPKPILKPQVTDRPPINLPESRPGLLNSGYKMVCYFTNWAWYRPGIGKYSPEDIDPSLCTHIVYGFAVLGDDGLITAHDTWADYDNRFYERVVAYKRYGIKVSLAVGGWNDSASDKYSKLVNSPSARAKFVKHAVQFLEKYNFDGLDLDWEYPICWQVDCSKGPDSDKDGFSDLIRELSAVLKPKGLLLSSAVSPNKKVIDEGYDVPVLSRYLDWIAVMTYDYHGHWDKKVGHVAPLYYYPYDDNTYFNANYTIHYWMAKGAPSSKLVMGVPLYGQSFTIDEPFKYTGDNAMVFNSLAIAGGEPGEYTRAKGFLAYYEICDRIKNRKWQVIEDPYPLRMGPIAFKDDQFVSYDNVDIIKAKVNFLKSLKLGGAMVWALDLDDFRNRCGEGKHPLMNAIKKELLNPRIDVESPRPVPIVLPAIPIEIDDLEDIEVRPGYTKKTTTTARPIAQTTQMLSTQTTKRPIAVASPEERYKVVCYYTNWAWYRPGSGKFTPSDIDPSLCTHIVYAFAVLDTERLVIKPHDTWLDVENMFFEKVVALKKRGLKVVLGLGGWNDSAGDKYSRLVNNPSARRKFIIHAVDFIKQYDFDGLDLDWEYPRCWQVNCEKGPSSDKQGFASLVKELRIAFRPHGLLLSAAVSASKRVIDVAYDVSTLSTNLDWIALMTYDYHGQWDKKTGHVAPMYGSENDEHPTFNTNFTVHYWIDKGAARQKLVLGIPFYGQSFSLEENAGTGLGVPTYAGGEAGDETRARGFLAFYEICERIRVQGWKVYRDAGGRIGPYATKEDQWVSFDDDFMVRHKAEYVRAMGLGGGMVWAMDLDDFAGKYCGCGNYPLLANINHVLRGHPSPAPCQLMEIQAPTTATDAVTETSVASEPQQMHFKPAMNINSDTLEGSSCAGVTFKADDKDCAKYYLCLNGQYIPLSCPSPLLWNENHCDLPEKTRCKTKGLLRITADENNQGEDFYDKPILACYFTSWAYYRQGEGRFGPEQVEASRCTHVVYSWAHLNATSNELLPGNPELDIENDFFGKLTELRQNGIKMIIGAGGLEDSEDDKWSKMAADPKSREIFINSVLKFLKTWNFDGVQLAWQYPVCKQTPCKDETNHLPDRDNFSVLLADLSRTLRDQNYEISVMVSANPEIASLAYEPYVLTLSADWISIAANDYYASNTGKTNYLIAFENSDVPGTSSFNGSLAYWLGVVPAQQLVMGVPAYGRSYTLVHAHAGRAPGAAASGPGEPGPYTAVPGFLAYYEVCPSAGSGWQEMVTEEGTFAWRGLQWAAYVRPAEVHRVAASVRAVGARGAALWALDLDDWRGRCGCEARPLLAALRLGLLEPALPPALCL